MHIYFLDIDDEDVEPITDSGGLDVDEEQLLDEIGSAKPISSPPNAIDPDVTFTGCDAPQRAVELHELLNSTHHAPLPVTMAADGADGYYVASSSTRYIKPSDDEHRREVVRTSLTRAGTDQRLVRALEAAPRLADHEFGNDLEAHIALPTDARKVRWFDPDSGDRELAEPVETVATAYGDVDVYDLEGWPDYEFDPDDPSEAPLLVYEIDKDRDAEADVRLWDTRGYESLEADGRRQWQHVFSKDHEYGGAIVLDTGRLRLWLDEDDGTVDAQEWDSSEAEWTDLELAAEQPESVAVFDIDVREIGMVRDVVQVTFDVDGELFAMDAILESGAGEVLLEIPDGEDKPVPEAVEDWLEPIASRSLVDAQATKTLISRSNLER
ncbi:hypothetical protein [Natrarchaeobaculum sulfurireducens]|uniref:Uncharacterized protein n=1 Tax=Natrarchaeobaculum sulfurireducens TaxID=2044521 RepID=A0A346PMN8_9EURY|nr:hypothetical protein [Natrarchaeobaculum sulfurireducens]AXR80783.1 hypothetical protein AArcMg_0761 [Natrarchaeobaculum sulfurireducens]